MRKIEFGTSILLFVLSVFAAGTGLFLAGCDRFEGDQDVPAYLRVESLGFTTDFDTQGTASQTFSDVWVYIDDDLIGGFEMPVNIPILHEGPHKLEIRPGVILNGISDTRAPHPCVKPIIVDGFNLIIDSVVAFNGSSTYWENAEFIWMEDFEDPVLLIKQAPASDTGMTRTQPANAAGAFLDEFSQFSGVSYLDATRKDLLLISDDGAGGGFVIDRGDFVFLELHYRMNLPLNVGLFIETIDNTVIRRSFLIVNPTDVWKKIYINFTPIVNETTEAKNYKIYFETSRDLVQEDGFLMLDNIKLITRPNL